MAHPTLRSARLLAVAATLATTAVLGVGAPVNAQVVNSPNTHVVNRSTTPTTLQAPAVLPLGTSLFTVGVKCGWWKGQVQWGGIGIISNPGYVQATGTVHSSCNSTTYVYIKYSRGLQPGKYTLFAKTGPKSVDTANFYSTSIAGPIGNIYIKACSNRYGWTCKAHKA
jgi:hypothetical protein